MRGRHRGGRFIGATDEASAVYEANFTDSSNVAVTITCAVTRPADTSPTSSGASLTALADIGVTGILVNMFMTALGAIASNSNNALYQDGSTGTLAVGSDQALSSDITIWRVRWNNDSNRIILNNNNTGSLQTYFTANTDKSLYVIFEDGTYVELPQANLVSTGTTWAQWSVTDANIVAKLNALTTTSDLLIGIADAGSIGVDANSGSGTATVTATPRPLPAPSVPASLSAAAIDHDSVRLSFTASTGTVTQYQYRYATSTVGLSSAVWANGGTGTTIDVDGLTPSTQYYFQVRACNQTVYSAASNTANATTQAAPLPAPSTPGSLSAAAVDHDTIRLTFSASTGTVTQYQYKVATSSAGLGSAVWADGGTGTTIDVDGLTPSTQYYFQVRALNQTVASAASNTANATTQAPPLVAPSVPGSFAVTVVDHDTVRLTFSASTGTVTQYQYRYATSSVGLSSAVWADGGTGTTITVNGLSPSTLYYFQVRACNQTVYSAATSALTATTQAVPLVAPSVPSSLSATAIDHDSVRLTFGASTGTVTQYQYRYATASAGLSSAAWTNGGTSTTIVVNGLSPSTQYYFQVRALNQTEPSAASNTATATTTERVTGPLAIQAISSPLNILINTPYELPVNITGNPTDVQVRGDLQFWDYEWNDPQLRLFVNFSRQVSNKTFTIYAVDPADSTNIIQQTVTYNAVSPAPIISAVTAPPIVKGDSYHFFIPVTNMEGSEASASGLFTGTGYEPHAIENADGSNTEGVLIYGDVADVDRSVDAGTIRLLLKSDRHTVMRDFPYPIQDINYDNLIFHTQRGLIAISRTASIGRSGTIVPPITYQTGDINAISSIVSLGDVNRNELYLIANTDGDRWCVVIGKTDPSGTIRRRFKFVDEAFAGSNLNSNLRNFAIIDATIYALYVATTGSSNQYYSAVVTTGLSDISDGEELQESDYTVRVNSTHSGLRSADIAVDSDTIYLLKISSSISRIYGYRRSNGQSLGYVNLPNISQGLFSGITCDSDYLYYKNQANNTVEVFSTPITFNSGTLSRVGAILDMSSRNTLASLAI